jgi:hypothetical protein
MFFLLSKSVAFLLLPSNILIGVAAVVPCCWQPAKSEPA